MANEQAVATLNRLIRLCIDGELGFSVAAESVRNRGLKTLLRSYAQQRALFAHDLQVEVEQLGGKPRQEGSALGRFHRGWIDIKAAMTVGAHAREMVVLAEVERGESVARREYERALEQALPAGVREMVAAQYESLQEIAELIERLRGRSGAQVVVRLFNTRAEADQAIEELERRGFSEKQISEMDMGRAMRVYQDGGRRSTTGDATSAGVLGGLIVGVLFGLLVALATLFVPGMDFGMGSSPVPAVLAFLMSVGAGALFGGAFGALIGRGVSEEDRFLYADSVVHGEVLLVVATTSRRAEEASKVMMQVNTSRAVS
ncbi:MAG: PA2169 family four-helix-bundle protein [Candidatus Promineifilaceae bacterium]